MSRADPESFARGVQLWQRLSFLYIRWGARWFKYHYYKWAIIGSPAKRHSNAGEPMMAAYSGIWILPFPRQLKKTLSMLDPLWQNILDPRM